VAVKTIHVNDQMQKNYSYRLTQQPGSNFAAEFTPQLTPKQMLELGIFGGKYMTDCMAEFPDDWFLNVNMSADKPLAELNYFEVLASQPLAQWQIKGWIRDEDPRGWFQWYCRYYMGRRLPEYDNWQIKRWKAIVRHIGQIKKHCHPGDLTCRRKQRQALLQWAYDSRKI
jgi:hypothetical protein